MFAMKKNGLSLKFLINFMFASLVLFLLLTATAHAGTTGAEFKETYDLVMGWAKGYLGKNLRNRGVFNWYWFFRCSSKSYAGDFWLGVGTDHRFWTVVG